MQTEMEKRIDALSRKIGKCISLEVADRSLSKLAARLDQTESNLGTISEAQKFKHTPTDSGQCKSPPQEAIIVNEVV